MVKEKISSLANGNLSGGLFQIKNGGEKSGYLFVTKIERDQCLSLSLSRKTKSRCSAGSQFVIAIDDLLSRGDKLSGLNSKSRSCFTLDLVPSSLWWLYTFKPHKSPNLCNYLCIIFSQETAATR